MKGYFTYKKESDKLWINDVDNSSLAISLLLNNRYDRLETTDKTITGAINELFNKKIDLPKNIYTKEEVDHLLNDLSRNITDSHTFIINKCVKEAKEQVEQEIKDSKKETENELPKLIDKALEKGFTDLINKLVDNKIKELNDRLFDSKEQKLNWKHFCEDIVTIEDNRRFKYKQNPWVYEKGMNHNDIPEDVGYVDININKNIKKWKEIGIKKDVRTIEYNFIKNKKYQVYYSFLTSTDPNDFSYNIKEFIYGGNTGRQYLESWEDLSKNIYYLQIYNNTICITSSIRGKIFKLEELQE